MATIYGYIWGTVDRDKTHDCSKLCILASDMILYVIIRLGLIKIYKHLQMQQVYTLATG